MRNCLRSKEKYPTASCAGVCWSDQECARVRHKLGTSLGSLLNHAAGATAGSQSLNPSLFAPARRFEQQGRVRQGAEGWWHARSFLPVLLKWPFRRPELLAHRRRSVTERI